MVSNDTAHSLLSKAAEHFNDARPFLPMYIHLLLSALFPIYAGAHASLSRPSSAAKPDKKRKKTEEDDEDEEDEKIQKMEGMSNTDAIVLPVTAAIVLAGLYFLIMRYGADLINLVLGWYFSAIGVYSVSQLVNDALNFALGFVFPNYFASQGSLWRVSSGQKKVIREGNENQTKDVPLPPLSVLPLPASLKSFIWSLRQFVRQKYALTAFVDTLFDIRANVTIITAIAAASGLATVIYVNTVSKLWFLTNLQGFAVSYSALQIMSPTTFSTGSLILSALFCYDIWAVFFTPLMVTVAKNLDQPIKLVFPRPDEPSATPGEPPVKSFSMLGLGDIVLPGLMVGLALRFDLWLYYYRKQTKTQKTVTNSNGEDQSSEVVEKAKYVSPTGRWGDKFWTWYLPASSLPAQLRASFPKPYFTASMVGYVFGMLATLGVMSVYQHAQPALLYLVPGVLTSLWGTALVRGELKEMLDFSEAMNVEQLEEDDAGNDTVTGEQQPKGLFDRLWEELWGSSTEAMKDEKGAINQSEAGQKANTDEEKSGEQGNKVKDKARDDIVFHFSLRRHNPRRSTSKKTKTALQSDRADDEDEAASGSTSALDSNAGGSQANGTVAHRPQTRSSRSSAKAN